MKRLVFPILVSVLALMVLFFSTNRVETGPESSKGIFRTYLTSEPTNLDPARGVDVSEGSVQSKIFDGLVEYDSKMNLVGALADSWEVSADGTLYTFNLRRGVVFHNGQELKARDVVFSLDRVLDPKVSSPRTWVLERVSGASERMKGDSSIVSGITAVDDYTVTIKLLEPFAPFISLLTMPACYILPEASAEAITNGSFFDRPAGTGPFRLTERRRDSYIRLDSNRNYFRGVPSIKAIEMRIIPETLKAEMEFEGGNLDILRLHPSNYARFKNDPRYGHRIHNVAAMNVFYIGFNNQKAPFDDVRVRRALNMLIDRKALIDAVFEGRGTPAKGSIPPGISGYSPDAPGYRYDPDTALKLLAEAGYTRSKPLEFDLYQRSTQAAFEITRLIQGELKKHGVVVNIRPMEWSALLEAITSGESDAFYLSWFADYPDGENFLYPLFHSSNWGSGGNRARFKNDKIDRLLESALRINSSKERAEAYDLINRMIVEEAPWLYLWHSNESYLIGQNVESITISPLFTADKGLETRLKR